MDWLPRAAGGKPGRPRPAKPAGEQRSRIAAELAKAGKPRPAPPQPVQILEGTAAHRDAFLQALTAAPSTIHLATHVLTSATRPEQAFLAFSLDASGSPGLLSTSEIGMLHVPGALIVMTGCATGTGDARVGAGLLGLTRAWMMAGAKAVVATNWPVPDADGDLIPSFYRHLRSEFRGGSLAPQSSGADPFGHMAGLAVLLGGVPGNGRWPVIRPRRSRCVATAPQGPDGSVRQLLRREQRRARSPATPEGAPSGARGGCSAG